jgi:HD-like signal output (HDOD) protein
MPLTVRQISLPAPRGEVLLPDQARGAVEKLLGGLDDLPGQRSALLRVAGLSDDEETSLEMLALACAADPPFAARLLAMANSAYYSRRDPATSLEVAITTVGRESLRSLALVTALGLSGQAKPAHEGFWAHAANMATASAQVARGLGARSGDAFCAGLLADVGQALLLQAAPGEYGQFLGTPCDADRREAEIAWCGVSHADLGASVMGRLGLPAPLCSAVALHDGGGASEPAQDPLGRSVQVGVLLARVADAGELDEQDVQDLAILTDGVMSAADANRLILQSASAAAALAIVLR